MSRAVYRRAELLRLLSPRSVAVVGASTRGAGFGTRALAHAKAGGFEGALYAVNPKYEVINGIRCYPSLHALPDVPDCILVALPHGAVEPVIAEAAELGVGGAIIFTSGFAETGKPERAALQQRLMAISQTSGLRIVGPNCIGMQNFAIRFHGSFYSVRAGTLPLPRKGAIGLVSQSGALGFGLSQAMERGVSFSHLLTCGNACDVDVADQVAYLADDPACAVIACVFEGLSDPARLLQAAALAADAGKPLVIYKMATGATGTRAALSHTGSLAGSNEAYRAAFRRAGVITVDDFEALIETASFFTKAPPDVRAPGVAVVATSGGACIMAADKADMCGMPLPQPAPATRAVLERAIPEFGSANNPCDVTAQVITDPGSLSACVDALLQDPSYSALVVAQPAAINTAAERLKIFHAAAQKHGKPVCVIWLPQWLEGPGALENEHDDAVALFHSTARCFATLRAWHDHAQWRRMRGAAAPAIPSSAAGCRQAGREVLLGAASNTLTEYESKQLLKSGGIPVTEDRLARTAGEAIAAAKALGYPVVLKANSPDIAHKTDAGVVRLGINSEQALRAAYDEISANLKTIVPPPRDGGISVQPMVPAGIEVMLGARMDPLFGPLVVVGLGGVWVELMKDVAIDLAPVTAGDARAMLQRLKGKALLDGFRGAPAVDLDQLSRIVSRFSRLVADHAELLVEIDVNPLICAGGEIVAVDALVVRRSGSN